MPAQPVAAAQVAGASNLGNAPVPTINPESTTQESMRRVALQNMDEAQFKKAQEGMNASDKEYWSEQARLNPLNTYANLRNYFASEETPEEQRKRERREHLGQVFSNLGNLIGNAAQLYYTAKGAVPADLNAGALAENERMRRIKEKRDALKARQDAILAEAKGDDIRNAYNVRLAREKAAADAADKQKGRDLDLMKFGMKLKADKDKADADRKLKEQQAKETGRHNRAMEANAARAQDKIVDSVIGADGNIYTRNTRYLLSFQPVGKTFYRVPVIILLAVIAHDNCLCMNFFTLHKSRQSVGLDGKRRYTIVSYKRISKRHQLSCIRGVCKAFGISGHGCIKHNLARYGLFVAERLAAESAPVVKDKGYVSH